MNKFSFAGIKIDNITLEEVIEKVKELIKKGKTSYIVTPNAAHIVLLQKDKEFRKVYENAELVLCDGQPIIWISKIFGEPLKERITGVDLLFSLLQLSSKEKYGVYLLGAKEGIIKRTVENLQKKFPELRIVGYHNGYFIDDEKMIKEINERSPDILFIGMGFPKQEKWIFKYIKNLDIKIAVCIGGVFDIVAGKTKRAPVWMQKIGMEWFFRLIQEPKRLWKRYLIGNTLFLWLVFKEFIKIKILKKK